MLGSDCGANACVAGTDDGALGAEEKLAVSGATHSGNVLIQVVALTLGENAGFAIRVEEAVQEDGDTDEADQEAMEADGDLVDAESEAEDDLDGDSDSDVTDQEVTEADADFIDAENEQDGDTVEAYEDDTTLDGDTIIEPKNGSGGGCSGTSSGSGLLLGLLLGVFAMRVRREET